MRKKEKQVFYYNTLYPLRHRKRIFIQKKRVYALRNRKGKTEKSLLVQH